MPNSRRLTGLWQAIRERRTRSLLDVSKRVSATLWSILNPTPEAPEEVAADPRADSGVDEALVRLLTTAAYEERLKLSGECDGTLPGESLTSPEEKITPLSGISRQPSTKKAQEIIDWVNQQLRTAELSCPDANVSSPVEEESGPDNGRGDATPDIADKEETGSIDSIPTRAAPSGRISPRKPHHSRTSQDPKTRVLRELQKDQFAPPSRRGTFESQHRGIYGFQIPSATSLSDQFPLSRRDSEGTVGTTTSGTVSDATCSKRFSASTIATSLMMTGASSEILHGQVKRIRPDSRASSYRSGSIPSVRSSAHASNPHAPRHKALPSLSRDIILNPDETHPPMPTLPRQTLPTEDDTTRLPLPPPPWSVLEAGTLAQRRRGWYTSLDPGIAADSDSVEELQIPVPREAGDGFLSVINEHLSDAGSTMPASGRPSLDRRSDAHDYLTDGRSFEGRQSSEGPSIFEREVSPLESSTSATSLGDLLNHASHDSSDVEDTMSDITDHTDISLIEAFEASPTPFDPVLLSLLMSLKEEVVDRIKQRLQMMMLQTHGPQQHIGKPSTSGSNHSEAPAGNTNKATFATAFPSRKRAFEEDADGSPGRRGGDDREKKRKDATSRAQLEERLRKFACPFYKRYPKSENLSKSCQGPGWVSAHRVKEHIYRRHQRPPFRCTRCLDAFDDEDKLTEHLRADPPCDIKTEPPEEETIYISKTQELALRKRKREVLEEERWFNVFRILFPNFPAGQLPSPYHETLFQEQPANPANLDEFRAFLLQELPSRIASGVNEHLRIQPPGAQIERDMTELIRSTMQEVMEDYRPILASPRPDTYDFAAVAVEQTPSQTTISQQPQPILISLPHANTLTAQTLPPPSRVAPPPSPPSNWGFFPFSDSPSASTFDFGFTNQGRVQALIDTPMLETPFSVGEMPTSWAVDDNMNNELGVLSFLEDLDGAQQRLDNVQSS
ncbi:hypothetical protein B0T25DRAFT_279112 [Lasiosphaeria hispida]|uniref:C2H2-type domain-containing protein n=1 Tax=Lasiosphaeria hispida TaxID=260671 RepID=A0AAJ0HBG8_9PEZI|nr:hypothetical protein B0T25DRAFT_279112 [Lasiosphaeria hispida]